MTVRLVNNVAVSDWMVSRLQTVADHGSSFGCSNCTNLTMERLASAGLLRREPVVGYVVTGEGFAFLEDEAKRRRRP